MTISTYEPQNDLTAQMEYAKVVSSASMLPDNYRGKPADIMLAVGLGQSMGLSPAESLYRISVIKGKPTASAELVAANVRKAGHRLRVIIEPGKATATIVRADDPEFEFTVVRDAAWAQQMGLASNDNYKKQGDTMLSWRAITACARLACPEALYGVAYTPDEMLDGGTARHTITVETPASASDRMADILKPSAPAESSQAATPDSVAIPPEGDVDSPAGAESVLLDTRSNLAKAMYASINEAGITDDERLPWISSVIGREIESSKEMTEDDARAVLRKLDEAAEIEDAEVVS